jgi:integrase
MPSYTDALVNYGVWRLTRGAASTHTVRGESPGLRAFGTFLGNPEVRDITDEDVGRWWDQLDLADSTKGTRLTQLRGFFRYALNVGWIASDPTALIRAPRVAPVPRDRLSADELLSLLDCARTPRDRCLLALAMNLAVRGGEIKRMRWRDVDFANQTIRVFVDKTNDVDDMPISADLLTELGVWSLFRPRPTGAQENHYLIPSQHIAPSGTVTYRWGQSIAEPYEPVKYALEQFGWEDVRQEGVHTVRRSMARIYFDMVEEGESFDSALLATMTLLHHSRPETTLTYVGRDRATLARDRLLRGRPFLTAMRKAPELTVVA